MGKPARLEKEERNPKVLLLIEADDQKESLHHPVRKYILRILSTGINDFETETTTEMKTLEDGTGLTRSVEVKRPIQRYWMTVPEIVEGVEQRYPKLNITSYQCYYHLQKLEEQGLVEQDPPSKFNDDGRKKRTRGIHFRTTARFFIFYKPGFSPGNPDPCLEFLQNGWGLAPSEEDCERLAHLAFEQDLTLFKALEHIAGHMNEIDVDSVTFSVLLERLAHVFLSDNEEFIERYRDAKKILIRSGGGFLDSDETLTTLVGNDVKEGETRGIIDE